MANPTVAGPTAQGVMLVERFALTVPVATFEAAIGRALARLERDGIPALRAVNFWVRPQDAEVSAVLEFSDAGRMLEHMQMVGSWPEFEAIVPMIRLLEMRVHGPLPPECEAWIRRFGDAIVRYDDRLGGFRRAP